MSNQSESSSLFGKARSLVRSLRQGAADRAKGGFLTSVRERMAYPIGLSAAAAKALVLRLEGPLRDLADGVAGQLLSLDDAAAQLAIWVEQSVEVFGREAIISTVLRRNLLLDGTILSFIDPLLRGKPLQDVDASVLKKGRLTLINLLTDIAALDDGLPQPPAETDDPNLTAEARLAWLDSAGLDDDQFFALRAGLAGEGTPEAQTHFLMNSYLLFLQSFLLRTVVRMLGDLARGDDPMHAAHDLRNPHSGDDSSFRDADMDD